MCELVGTRGIVRGIEVRSNRTERIRETDRGYYTDSTSDVTYDEFTKLVVTDQETMENKIFYVPIAINNITIDDTVSILSSCEHKEINYSGEKTAVSDKTVAVYNNTNKEYCYMHEYKYSKWCFKIWFASLFILVCGFIAGDQYKHPLIIMTLFAIFALCSALIINKMVKNKNNRKYYIQTMNEFLNNSGSTIFGSDVSLSVGTQK